MQGEELVACVLRAHEVLERESDLSPRNPTINTTLSALVQGVLEGCGAPEAGRVLADPRVAAIRAALVQRLALAEGALERHWAHLFSKRMRLTAADLAQFPYWDCYRHLIESELVCLRPYLAMSQGESLAFVGAGPLPLSAVMVHAITGVKVTCVDANAEACRLAAAVLGRAGLTDIDVACAAGADHEYAPHPVTIVASLVPDKVAVMRRIRTTHRAAVVGLRSAEGLCTLLYDPVDEAAIEALGCGYLTRTAANPRAINTTLIYAADPVPRPDRAQTPRSDRRTGPAKGSDPAGLAPGHPARR